MTKVLAGITTSLDGYISGPDDGPGKGLGEGGERLHYWVFGGPWSYADERYGDAVGADRQYLDRMNDRVDDYKRLLEKRRQQSPEHRESQAEPRPLRSAAHLRTGPEPVS